MRVLFVKKSGRVSGGHIKFHEYFEHCLAHPGLDPYVYLGYASADGPGVTWEDERDRIVSRLDVDAFDAIFIDGRDWELLPRGGQGKTIIHLIQDFRHGDADDPRFAFLSRPALRICVGPELADAVRLHANGPVAVIVNGIDTSLFAPRAKEPGSVVIWTRKDRELGKQIERKLKSAGVSVTLLSRPIARPEFAALLASSDIFVGLTKEREGFFLPALEAMASGCVVVCADAIGNRSFCVDEETCRIARYGDGEDHVRLVLELIEDQDQARRLQMHGSMTARGYSLERERAQFYDVVDEHVLARSGAGR